MLVILLRGENFRFLVSLRVFWAKRQYFWPSRSRLGLQVEKSFSQRSESSIYILRLINSKKVLNDHSSELPIGIKKPEKIQGFSGIQTSVILHLE